MPGPYNLEIRVGGLASARPLCYVSSAVKALLTAAVGAACAAVLLVVPATGSAALSCGLPEAQPVWIDFADGSVSFFRERFARPGIVVATGGPGVAAEARAAGAVSVRGCQQPLIALNELWGASLPAPLTPTAERYRVNVLRFVSRLAERGGRPALLVSSEPNTAGDAAAWWRGPAPG